MIDYIIKIKKQYFNTLYTLLNCEQMLYKRISYKNVLINIPIIMELIATSV